MPTTTKKAASSTAVSAKKKVTTTSKKAPAAGNKKGAGAASKKVVEAKNPGQAALDAKLAAEAQAKQAAAEAEREQQERWSGRVWPATLPEMPKAIKKAQDEGLTPLILDQTPHKAVDTFYSYQMAQVVEGKKLVMQGRDPAGLAQVMEESRQLLLRAMAKGFTLYLRMTNCAADIVSSYQDPKKLPVEVWDHSEVRKVLGENLVEEDSPLKGVVDEDACFDHDMGSKDYFQVHKDFHVVVCSHFEVEDYEEFLARALPLDRMQAILINEHD